MGIRPDVKLHRNGVRIIGACIDEPIDLENAQIPCEVHLEHCQFSKNVTFSRAEDKVKLSDDVIEELLPSSRQSVELYVRPLASIAATHTAPTPTGLAEIVSDDFPILHLEPCSHHGLLFKTSPNDSEQHGGNDSNPSQEGFMKIKLTYHHQLCRAGRVFPL